MLSKHLHSILLGLLATITLVTSSEASSSSAKLWNPIFYFLLLSCFLLFILKNCLLNLKHPSVYLVDFSCFKPPSFCKASFSQFIHHTSTMDTFDSESVEFMTKILSSSGLGQETYISPAFHSIPPKINQQESIKEAEMMLFPVMDDLLSKTKLSPHDIDILIVNCSGFCPSPSLSSIIINKYSMRSDVKSFNLSGMGCSAGAIGIDLVQNLLKIHKNSNAIVLSTEILSAGMYSGREKSMLILNCLFRMGSSGILLTNRKEARNSSKYKLLHAIRTQRAFDDRAHFSVSREEDSSGKLGLKFTTDFLQAAAEILKSHVTTVGSRILPFTSKLRYVISVIRKKLIDKSGEIHTPSFKSVIQHFCLPTSSKNLIKEIGKGLKLNERDVEAAFMTLHRFGNQSSSSWWYELAYMEGKERVKKGDKVWILGSGTGPKCCSLVLECLRPIVGEAEKGPWADSIHRHPIEKDVQTRT